VSGVQIRSLLDRGYGSEEEWWQGVVVPMSVRRRWSCVDAAPRRRGGEGGDMLAAAAAQHALIDLKVDVRHQAVTRMQLGQRPVREQADAGRRSRRRVSVAEGAAHKVTRVQTLELAAAERRVRRRRPHRQFVHTLSTPHASKALVCKFHKLKYCCALRE
jgi:hypothetical protein